MPITPQPNVDRRALEAELQRRVRGEVRFDAGSRALYATDASNYRQVPIGLVVPVDAADVEAAMAVCREGRWQWCLSGRLCIGRSY